MATLDLIRFRTELRYSDSQPRDSAGRFGVGDSNEQATHFAAGLKQVSDQEEAHGFKAGDKVKTADGMTGHVLKVAGNNLVVSPHDTRFGTTVNWHATKVMKA